MIGYRIGMTDRKLHTLPALRYTVMQGDVVEAIEDALKRRQIDFAAATELRDLVRAGQLGEVRAALDAITSISVTPSKLAGYSGKPG